MEKSKEWMNRISRWEERRCMPSLRVAALALHLEAVWNPTIQEKPRYIFVYRFSSFIIIIRLVF